MKTRRSRYAARGVIWDSGAENSGFRLNCNMLAILMNGMALSQKNQMKIAKVAFVLLCLIPLAWVGWRLVTGDLGAEPAERVNHKMGMIAFRMLVANLIWGSLIALGWAPKPFRRFGYLRRHLGVVTFVYAALHLAFYFLKEGDLGVAALQMVTKTYLIVGLVSWTLLLVLTVTSTDWAVRRMRANWKLLHRTVYAAMALAVIHFALIEKKDWTETFPYLLPMVGLYVIRLATLARGPKLRRAT